MENLMEMEYVINGEKYLITVTKVEDANDECTNCTCNVVEKPVDLSEELPECDMLEVEEDDEPLVFSVEDIPECICLADWLNIIKEYNIILTK